MDNNANVGAAKRKVEAALEHAEEQLENLKQQMQMVTKDIMCSMCNMHVL